jgi:hypothetical protein
MARKYESPVSWTLRPPMRGGDVAVHFITWLPKSSSSGESYYFGPVAKELLNTLRRSAVADKIGMITSAPSSVGRSLVSLSTRTRKSKAQCL